MVTHPLVTAVQRRLEKWSRLWLQLQQPQLKKQCQQLSSWARQQVAMSWCETAALSMCWRRELMISCRRAAQSRGQRSALKRLERAVGGSSPCPRALSLAPPARPPALPRLRTRCQRSSHLLAQQTLALLAACKTWQLHPRSSPGGPVRHMFFAL